MLNADALKRQRQNDGRTENGGVGITCSRWTTGMAFLIFHPATRITGVAHGGGRTARSATNLSCGVTPAPAYPSRWSQTDAMRARAVSTAGATALPFPAYSICPAPTAWRRVDGGLDTRRGETRRARNGGDDAFSP